MSFIGIANNIWNKIKSAAGSVVLLYDTFTDTLNSYLTSHTPDIGGPWALIKIGDINAYQIKDDGVYKNTNTTYASGYSPVISDIGLATGFRINVKGRMPSTAAGAGIVFRAQTPSAGSPTFMLANIQYLTMAIYFFNGSSFVNLASANNPDTFDNNWFDLSLEVQGDDISFYKNDVPIIQLTSAQNNTETRVGLAGYSTQANSRWDDYEVLV